MRGQDPPTTKDDIKCEKREYDKTWKAMLLRGCVHVIPQRKWSRVEFVRTLRPVCSTIVPIVCARLIALGTPPFSARIGSESCSILFRVCVAAAFLQNLFFCPTLSRGHPNWQQAAQQHLYHAQPNGSHDWPCHKVRTRISRPRISPLLCKCRRIGETPLEGAWCDVFGFLNFSLSTLYRYDTSRGRW